LRGFSVVLLLTALLSAKAWALTLDEIAIGEQIRGPVATQTSSDFTGKVVLVDLWGVHCIPCIQQMPAIQEMYNKYRFNGFHVVALECQAKTNGEAFEFFANTPPFAGNNYQFQFTYAGRTGIPGRYIPYLPQNFLFNSDGYLIGSNVHGDELDAKIKLALSEALETLTHPGEVGRLAPLEATLKSGKNMMETLSEIVRRKKSALETGDSKVIDEAALLFKGTFDWANKKYDRAMAEKERAPMMCLMRLRTVARSLKGTDVAERAAKAADELERDPRIVKELAADKALREIVTQISDLKATPADSRDPNDPEFRKLNVTAFKSMKDNCLLLQKVCPETEAATHAQTIYDEFRLKDVN
jgi:thiol-disulfide isomerase/thioredoxin